MTNLSGNYLYRGLREEEVRLGQLIPKGIQTFEDVKVVMANAANLCESKNLGPVVGVANHLQGFPTIGVSTSTLEKVAIFYATRGYTSDGCVARIKRDQLSASGIEEICPRQIFPPEAIIKIDNSEIILVAKVPGLFFSPQPFPKEIVDEIYLVEISELNKV